MVTRLKPKLNVAWPIKLKDAYISSLQAKVGPNPTRAGGKLRTKYELTTTEGDTASSAVSDLSLTVVGIPRDAKNEKDYSFLISATMTGKFDWLAEYGKPQFDTPDIQAILSRILYPMAVSGAKDIANRLGFGQLNMGWDIGDLILKKALADKEKRGRDTPDKPPKSSATKPS